MDCPNCQTVLFDHFKFCTQCGQSLITEKVCPHCETVCTPECKFCFECGSNLDVKKGRSCVTHQRTATTLTAAATLEHPSTRSGTVAEPGVQGAQLDPPEPPWTQALPPVTDDDPKQGFTNELKKYIPTHIVDQIMNKSSTQEEMKNVAVVFADVSGFTAMSEDMDPEEVTSVMNRCFQSMVDMVDRYEGTVNKFIGDCLMAIFGAPVAHEDDAERAIRATLGMLSALDEINQTLEINLGISVGINSGKVFAGLVGSDMRKEYTVMGDTVNLAQRLESAAGRGQILVGESVYELTKDKFDFEALDPIQVKGKKEKVQSYWVIGEKKLKSHSITTASKLVGREVEYVSLKTAFDTTVSGTGQMVYIHGEAGMGKSRLGFELSKVIKERCPGAHIYKSHCFSYAREPYYTFAQILKLLTGIETNDSESEQKSKFESLMRYEIDTNELHFLGVLLNLKFKGSNVQFFDDEKKKLSIFMALKKLFAHIAVDNPLVLILDNLQWADSLTMELISHLTESIPQHRWLVVLISRGIPTAEIKKQANVIVENLPLSYSATIELAKSFLNTETLPNKLGELLWDRAGGIPLFVEEILKSLKDSQHLKQGQSGQWELSGAIDAASIPANIHGIIASRIDKLNEATKRVLQYASVIGREFKYDLIKAVMAKTSVDIDHALLALEERGMIGLKQGRQERAYSFKSLLLMDTAYGTILKKRIREIHELVGTTIEQLYSDTLEMYYDILAHHFSRTNCRDKAVFYLENSGDRMMRAHELHNASKNFLRAVEIVEEIRKEDKSLDVAKHLATLLLKAADAFDRLGDLAKNEKVHDKVIKITKANGFIEEEIKATIGSARIQYLYGEVSKALAIYEDAFRRSEANNLKYLSSQILGYIGEIHERRGNTEEALKHLYEANEIARDANNIKQMGELNRRIGTTHLFSGNYQKALDYYNRALDIAEQIKDKTTMLHVLGNIGIVYAFEKNYDQSIRFYEKALTLAEELGDKIGLSRNLHNMGELHYETNNFEEALRCFEKSLPLSEETAWKEGYVNNLIFIGYLKHQINGEDHAAGRAILQDGIDNAEKYNFTRAIPMGNHLLGKTYLNEKNFKAARDRFEQALKVARDTDYKKYEEVVSQDIKELDRIESQCG